MSNFPRKPASCRPTAPAGVRGPSLREVVRSQEQLASLGEASRQGRGSGAGAGTPRGNPGCLPWARHGAAGPSAAHPQTVPLTGGRRGTRVAREPGHGAQDAASACLTPRETAGSAGWRPPPSNDHSRQSHRLEIRGVKGTETSLVLPHESATQPDGASALPVCSCPEPLHE